MRLLDDKKCGAKNVFAFEMLSNVNLILMIPIDLMVVTNNSLEYRLKKINWM